MSDFTKGSVMVSKELCDKLIASERIRANNLEDKVRSLEERNQKLTKSVSVLTKYIKENGEC